MMSEDLFSNLELIQGCFMRDQAVLIYQTQVSIV